MNTLLKLLILLTGIVAADIINSTQVNLQSQQANNSQLYEPPKDRKLIYSPYSLRTDYSANSVGNEGKAPEGPDNAMPGPFQDAPLPSFGLGGMMPPSLGLTNMPYNYMYGSAMMHPLNPMNGAGAMGMGGMGPMGGMGGMPGMGGMGGMPGMGSMGVWNGQNSPANNGGLGFADNDGANGMGNELANPTFDGSRHLETWGELPRALVRVGSYCQNTQKQAVEIANAIMKRQNRIIFKELMNYLLKSKYLIGMTEVKLTRVLRKKIYGLMSEYSNINETNVQFIPVRDNIVVQKEIVYQNATDTNAVQAQTEANARRNLAIKKGRQ